jgi:hypothetical protein
MKRNQWSVLAAVVVDSVAAVAVVENAIAGKRLALVATQKISGLGLCSTRALRGPGLNSSRKRDDETGQRRH